jgi:tetratricopeptide (TPR) repeat protein
MTNEDVEMFYKQAMSYLGQGNSEMALEFFNKALQIDPMYLPAWNDKGVALLELNDYKQALDCFERVIYLDPEVSMPLYNKGYVQLMLERYGDSVETFKIFLDSYPFKDDFYKYALYLKAKGHHGLKEYDDAKKLLEKAIKKDKSFKEARELLILILNESQKTS